MYFCCAALFILSFIQYNGNRIYFTFKGWYALTVEQMRSFIIKFVYYTLLIVLAYCILKFVVPFFMPFLLAFLIAMLLKSPTNYLSRRFKLRRNIIAVVLLILFYALVIALFTLLGAKLGAAATDGFKALPAFYSSTIEPALYQVQSWLGGFIQRLDPTLQSMLTSLNQNIVTSLGSAVSSISSSAVSSLTGFASHVPSFFVKSLLLVIASFFFVVDYYKVTSFLANLLPPKGKAMLFRIKSNGVDTMLKFARAYAILLTITFIELSIGLSILGVHGAVLIALGTALVDILPVLGTGTILIPWALYQLFSGNFFLGFGLAILYAIITVVRQILEPRIVGGQIGLYPLLTLVCMFIGAQLFGFWGMFALPIGLTIYLQLWREEHPAAAPQSPAGASAGTSQNNTPQP